MMTFYYKFTAEFGGERILKNWSSFAEIMNNGMVTPV